MVAEAVFQLHGGEVVAFEADADILVAGVVFLRRCQNIVVLTVEVADMPRGDGRRVQFAAKAWTEDGRQFDLLLSDYQKRDWAVGSRWKVSARLKPVIGEVNLRGLNREAWALANGLDGAGTLGKGRSLVREGGGIGLAVWRDAVSRRW